MAITTGLRKVNGYVLATSADSIYVRDVGGYVLADQVKLPPFGVAGATGLLNAINKEKGKSFTAAMLTFSAPQSVSDTSLFLNTTILVTAKPSTGYQGGYTFTYHRSTMAEAFDTKDVTQLPSGMGSTLYDSLAAVNSKFALALTTDDVVDVATTGLSFTLTAKSTSIYFQPGTSVVIGTP